MINHAEASSTLDDMEKNDDGPNNIVSMINSALDSMKKNDNAFNDIVSMIDSALDDMEKSNNDLGNIISMFDSTASNMKKSNDNLDNAVLTLNFTTDDMKKSNDDLDNAVSTLNFTTDDMKKNNNGNSNNTDAASTDNYKEPSDYDTETDDSVVADSNDVMKDIKDVSYNNSTVMENSEEETKHSGNAASTLDDTILPINAVEKCDANDNDDNIATQATKYVCFNMSTTADIKQLLSSL